MPSKKSLIYFVEDDPDVRTMFVELLGDEFNVATFGTAAELLATVSAHQAPDAFVIDIGLPGMSGIEMLEMLRARGHQQPAILASGRGDREQLIKSINLGVTAFIDKPLNTLELARAVEREIERSRDLASSAKSSEA